MKIQTCTRIYIYINNGFCIKVNVMKTYLGGVITCKVDTKAGPVLEKTRTVIYC